MEFPDSPAQVEGPITLDGRSYLTCEFCSQAERWYTRVHYEAFCDVCGEVFKKINDEETKNHANILCFDGLQADICCMSCGISIKSEHHHDPCHDESKEIVVCAHCRTKKQIGAGVAGRPH